MRFAIGDIHGCLDKLKSLMTQIGPCAEDTLIFLGDYIDRGPDSKGVVDYLINLPKRTGAECIYLKGNHEHMMLDYFEGKNEYWLTNGAYQTLLSYLKSPDPESSETYTEFGDAEMLAAINEAGHMEFFKNLKLFHEDEEYIYVHAGFERGTPYDQQDADTVLWVRYNFINKPTDLDKKVIFGHTPEDSFTPIMRVDKIGIDTGACFGGPLTAINLPNEIFYESK